jgi:hypothetical protein
MKSLHGLAISGAERVRHSVHISLAESTAPQHQ